MGCANSRDSDKKVNVLLIGLDQSGKSTLLYLLNEIEDLEPYYETRGTQYYEVQKGQAKIGFHETGGSDKHRDQWLNDLPYTDTIFYFIDSSDKSRFNQSLGELQKVLSDAKTQPYPVFVFLNKIDKLKGNELEGLKKQVDEILAGRKAHHKSFGVSCFQVESVNGSIDEVVNYFYPSCVLMQPKRLSKESS